MHGKGSTEEEENLERKVKQKPRHFKNQSTGNKSSKTTKTTTNVETSEYFQPSLKEEECDSEEDFDRGKSAAPPGWVNNKKEDEGEEDSEEDEDDWEEVEGGLQISFSCGYLARKQGCQ